MGKREADLDGIEYYYDPTYPARGGWGCTLFLIPCSRCGRKVKRTMYGRNKIFICDACALGEKKKHEALRQEFLDEIETKGERRFKAAIEELRKQVKDIKRYDKAIKAARARLEKYGSIPEAMVAIELLKLGYSIVPQQKVGGYRVDFYVPKERFVVEVDGEIFHRNNRNKDREAIVQVTLGLDVKIIHIPAELIRNHITRLGWYISKSLQMP